jgi:hypothetical protein
MAIRYMDVYQFHQRPPSPNQIPDYPEKLCGIHGGSVCITIATNLGEISHDLGAIDHGNA